MSMDLSQLPAPNVVLPLNFEAELLRLKTIMRDELRATMPEIDQVLELALESLPVPLPEEDVASAAPVVGEVSGVQLTESIKH